MYDNFCKYLIETYPADFASWLIGKPVTLTQLKPTELVSEPIRADSLMLQGKDVVLHVEFQTQTDPLIPRRMADYYLRIHKKFPNKQVRQVVIYLRSSRSPLVNETTFESGGMTHRFQVVRLWEQPRSVFWNAPGLLPFAILSQAANQDPATLLRQVKVQISAIAVDAEMQGNLETATSILAGLKLKTDVIKQIMRSRAMQESTFYQDLVQEVEQRGRQKWEQRGIEKGRLGLLKQIVPFLKGCGVPIEPLLKMVGVTMAELELEDEESEDN